MRKQSQTSQCRSMIFVITFTPSICSQTNCSLDCHLRQSKCMYFRTYLCTSTLLVYHYSICNEYTAIRVIEQSFNSCNIQGQRQKLEEQLPHVLQLLAQAVSCISLVFSHKHTPKNTSIKVVFLSNKLRLYHCKNNSSLTIDKDRKH